MPRSKTRGLPTVTMNIADTFGEELMAGIVHGVQADIPIGEAEIHRAKPVLSELDRENAHFRRGAGVVARGALSPR